MGIFALPALGLLVPATLVTTGVLLWVSRTVPLWSAALLVLGGGAVVASRPERIEALVIVADVVLIAGLAPVGWLLTRRKPVVADVMPTA